MNLHPKRSDYRTPWMALLLISTVVLFGILGYGYNLVATDQAASVPTSLVVLACLILIPVSLSRVEIDELFDLTIVLLTVALIAAAVCTGAYYLAGAPASVTSSQTLWWIAVALLDIAYAFGAAFLILLVKFFRTDQSQLGPGEIEIE